MHVLNMFYLSRGMSGIILIDTFVNSRLIMAAPRGKGPAPEPRPRPSFKNSGSGSNVQDTGGQNKGYHTPGFAKPPYVGDKIVRCWTCGSPNHRSADDWQSNEKPRPVPMSLFGKRADKQTQPSAALATPKSVPGQAKVNHASVSVQCDAPITYLPRARLALSLIHI